MSALAHKRAAMSESLPGRFCSRNLTSLLQGMLMDEWKGTTWATHSRVSSEISAAHAGWVWNTSAMEDLFGQVIAEHSSHRFWLQGTSGAAKRPLPLYTPHYILWGQSRFPVSRNKDINHSERLPRKLLRDTAEIRKQPGFCHPLSPNSVRYEWLCNEPTFFLKDTPSVKSGFGLSPKCCSLDSVLQLTRVSTWDQWILTA